MFCDFTLLLLDEYVYWMCLASVNAELTLHKVCLMSRETTSSSHVSVDMSCRTCYSADIDCFTSCAQSFRRALCSVFRARNRFIRLSLVFTEMQNQNEFLPSKLCVWRNWLSFCSKLRCECVPSCMCVLVLHSFKWSQIV